MTERIKPPEGNVLARWSRLKREAREKENAPVPTAGPAASRTIAGADTATDRAKASTSSSATAASATPASVSDLPPVESLTIDSDFTAYLQPKVDEALKRRALRQLFRDPHFNVMDGLDVYIDDYTKPDPIPPEIVREMVQGRYIFNPPPTRINAQGHVEDVPPEELAALERDAKAAAAEADAAPRSPLPPPNPNAAIVSPLPPPSEAAPASTSEAVGESADAGDDPVAKALPHDEPR